MNLTGRNGLQGNQKPQPRKQWGAPEVFDLSSLPLALYLIYCSFCRVVPLTQTAQKWSRQPQQNSTESTVCFPCTLPSHPDIQGRVSIAASSPLG